MASKQEVETYLKELTVKINIFGSCYPIKIKRIRYAETFESLKSELQYLIRYAEICP